MKIARVLITLACPRSCPYCCNGYDHIMRQARPITDLADLVDYDQVLLTGGEPMLYPDEIRRIIPILRGQRTKATTIYLYTALYTPELPGLLPLLDGAQFTLHLPFSPSDLRDFESFQGDIVLYPEKSFRLAISPDIETTIPVIPNRWVRVLSKDWRSEERCVLPPGEDFFHYVHGKPEK